MTFVSLELKWFEIFYVQITKAVDKTKQHQQNNQKALRYFFDMYTINMYNQ
jgi:hypothetical protein